MKKQNLFTEFGNNAACSVRQISTVTIRQALCKLSGVANTLWEHDPKLRQLRVAC
jgi:hypothetical protein